MNKIIFATTNESKLAEAREILQIEVEGLELKVDEIQTLNPIECVEKKAEAAYKLTKKPLIVEDTNLFFDVFNGLPGVFIDYFMKTVEIEGLLKMLSSFDNRKAKAQTNICYFDGKQKITTTGIINGFISNEAKGKNGFGWDPIFIPEGYNKTFAEFENGDKNKISMRKLAFDELRLKLQL